MPLSQGESMERFLYVKVRADGYKKVGRTSKDILRGESRPMDSRCLHPSMPKPDQGGITITLCAFCYAGELEEKLKAVLINKGLSRVSKKEFQEYQRTMGKYRANFPKGSEWCPPTTKFSDILKEIGRLIDEQGADALKYTDKSHYMTLAHAERKHKKESDQAAVQEELEGALRADEETQRDDRLLQREIALEKRAEALPRWEADLVERQTAFLMREGAKSSDEPPVKRRKVERTEESEAGVSELQSSLHDLEAERARSAVMQQALDAANQAVEAANQAVIDEQGADLPHEEHQAVDAHLPQEQFRQAIRDVDLSGAAKDVVERVKDLMKTQSKAVKKYFKGLHFRKYWGAEDDDSYYEAMLKTFREGPQNAGKHKSGATKRSHQKASPSVKMEPATGEPVVADHPKTEPASSASQKASTAVQWEPAEGSQSVIDMVDDASEAIPTVCSWCRSVVECDCTSDILRPRASA